LIKTGPINSKSNDNTIQRSPRNKYGFTGGISNYDFALKAKTPHGPSTGKSERNQADWGNRRDLFSADRA
jgi:hypothetical protein